MNDGQVTGLFVSVCSRNHGKGMKIEAFWTIVKKAIFLARFVDKDHQNRNFTLSKTIVSMIKSL